MFVPCHLSNQFKAKIYLLKRTQNSFLYFQSVCYLIVHIYYISWCNSIVLNNVCICTVRLAINHIYLSTYSTYNLFYVFPHIYNFVRLFFFVLFLNTSPIVLYSYIGMHRRYQIFLYILFVYLALHTKRKPNLIFLLLSSKDTVFKLFHSLGPPIPGNNGPPGPGGPPQGPPGAPHLGPPGGPPGGPVGGAPPTSASPGAPPTNGPARLICFSAE